MAGGTPRTRAGGPASFRAMGYDADLWSPNRNFIWQPVLPAHRDLDRYTRYELNRKAEYLWKNSLLIRGLIERLVTLTIGTGAFPTPKSEVKAWNIAVKKFWRKICKTPCVDSRMNMGCYQRIKARGRFKHGESFTVLTHNPATKRDGVKGLEWHRVDMPKPPGWVDNYTGVQGVTAANAGIDKDEMGLPVRYHVTGNSEPVDATFMVHHFTPTRDEQPRGETILAAAINTAQDVKEILDFEKQAVKAASATKDIIQTATGELDPEMFRKLVIDSQNPTPVQLPNDDVTKDNYYRVRFGAESVVLKTGDKYTPYQPNRPGNAWEGFMAFLANTIVLGTGMPPSLVLPIDIGGTDIRRDLKIGQRVVAAWQDDMAGEFQMIWEYFILGGIEDGILPKPPADWREVEWHFPESLTVDRAQAGIDREDVQAGLMTWDRYHGRSGNDGDEQEQIMINEVRRRRERIAGIAFSEPFESAAEFNQYLGIGTFKFTETFREMGTGDDGDASAEGIPSKSPKPPRKKRETTPAPPAPPEK